MKLTTKERRALLCIRFAMRMRHELGRHESEAEALAENAAVNPPRAHDPTIWDRLEQRGLIRGFRLSAPPMRLTTRGIEALS